MKLHATRKATLQAYVKINFKFENHLDLYKVSLPSRVHTKLSNQMFIDECKPEYKIRRQARNKKHIHNISEIKSTWRKCRLDKFKLLLL